MSKLQTRNERVKQLMEEDYDTRCSDRRLVCRYYQKYHHINICKISAYRLLMDKTLPKVSDIERAARKVRELYPALTVDKVQIARYNKEFEFIEMSQDKRI